MEINHAKELGWVNANEIPNLVLIKQLWQFISYRKNKLSSISDSMEWILAIKSSVKKTGFNLISELDLGVSVYTNLYIYSAQQEFTPKQSYFSKFRIQFSSLQFKLKPDF